MHVGIVFLSINSNRVQIPKKPFCTQRSLPWDSAFFGSWIRDSQLLADQYTWGTWHGKWMGPIESRDVEQTQIYVETLIQGEKSRC